MQLHARRSADQWRGYAALDARNSCEPATRYDSAGRYAAWGHQHRSDSGGYANAEYVGMRREHDDESGDARHDGTSQRHRRRGNAGRIASTRLLMQTTPAVRVWHNHGSYLGAPVSNFGGWKQNNRASPKATGALTTLEG
jgi:hypothetical protein